MPRAHIPQVIDDNLLLDSSANAENSVPVCYQHTTMIVEAMRCALQVNSFDTAIALIELHGVSIIRDGQVQVVQAWLESLPPALVSTHPFLNLLSAYIMLYNDQLEHKIPLQYTEKASLKGRISQYAERGKANSPARPVFSISGRATFTEREEEVLALLIQGATNREIAAHLTVSEGTVKKHIANICNKLGVKSRTQVVATLMGRPA